jgi:hypothetical protein
MEIKGVKCFVLYCTRDDELNRHQIPVSKCITEDFDIDTEAGRLQSITEAAVPANKRAGSKRGGTVKRARSRLGRQGAGGQG